MWELLQIIQLFFIKSVIKDKFQFVIDVNSILACPKSVSGAS